MDYITFVTSKEVLQGSIIVTMLLMAFCIAISVIKHSGKFAIYALVAMYFYSVFVRCTLMDMSAVPNSVIENLEKTYVKIAIHKYKDNAKLIAFTKKVKDSSWNEFLKIVPKDIGED